METAAKITRMGDRILSILAAIMIAILFLYGAYSLWDTWRISHGAFVSEDLLKYKPAADNPANPSLYDLQKLNPDVRAWITIDDTHIDYPVVQGKDDMEYINKDVYGNFVLSGAIFLSHDNSGDFSDSYSLLYGHHMDNGAMFGDVEKFEKEDFFTKHTSGTLYIPGSDYKIEIFACVTADAYDNVIYNPSSFKTGDNTSLLSYIKSKAVQYRDIQLTGGDRIIGLSTCADAETNGRIILFGKLDKTN